MFNDVYNLKWKHFKVNQDSTLEELFTKNNNQADVTLVSDDKVAFPAHKFILGACSPILKDLLINNPHPHPMIELSSILQFIYLGKTQFFHSRMQNFFETGRELQIKQLSQPLIQNDEDEVTVRVDTPFDDCKNKIDFEYSNKKNYIPSQDQLQRFKEERSMVQKYKHPNSKSVNENIEKPYICKKCQAKFRSRVGLWHHRKNKHEGVSYSCDRCDYKAILSQQNAEFL